MNTIVARVGFQRHSWVRGSAIADLLKSVALQSATIHSRDRKPESNTKKGTRIQRLERFFREIAPAESISKRWL